MIEWFTTIAIIVSVVAGLAALVLGGLGRKPDDYSVLPMASVALVLLVQIVIGIVAPFVGNEPTGDIVEWWIYLVVALVLPVAAIAWAGVSVGFSVYLANFNAYNAIYGSIGAVIILMVWLYLSVWAVLLGGAINAELDEQMQVRLFRRRQ